MSAGGSEPGRREVAHRLFAAEYDDADFSYSESDEERAPNYVVTPTGARVNRLFAAGVLTEIEPVNEEMLRARVVDPTGAFVVYAGQYQPEALAFLERVDSPAFLAVTGKARTFQPEDSDRVYTSIRPESISEVDAETRDRWVVGTAQRTIERVETMAAAIDSDLSGDALREALEADGVDPSLAAGIPLALDHYGTTPDYLAAVRDLAEETLAMVAGDVDEVGGLDVRPGVGAGDASALADHELAVPAGVSEPSTEPATTTGAEPVGEEQEPTAESEPDEPTTTEPAASTDAEAGTGTDADESEPAADESESAVAASDEPAEPETTTPSTSPEEQETTATTTAEDDATDDDIGDFEPDETFDPDDEVLTDEEREEAEELGGFSTGNEVEEPGEADIETPDADPGTEESVEDTTAEAEPDPEEEADATGEVDDTDETGGTDESDETDDGGDVSLEAAVMDAMADLDDGDGAPHDAIVETVADRTGASPEAVDDAIQDALMSGRCYEPADDHFKPI